MALTLKIFYNVINDLLIKSKCSSQRVRTKKFKFTQPKTQKDLNLSEPLWAVI